MAKRPGDDLVDSDFDFENDAQSAPPPPPDAAAGEFDFEEMPNPARGPEFEPIESSGGAMMTPPVEDDFEPDEPTLPAARVEPLDREAFGGGDFDDIDEVPRQSRRRPAADGDDSLFDDAELGGETALDTDLDGGGEPEELEEIDEETPRGSSPLVRYGIYGAIGLVVVGAGFYAWATMLSPMLGFDAAPTPTQTAQITTVVDEFPSEQKKPALPGMATVPEELVQPPATLPGAADPLPEAGAPVLPNVQPETTLPDISAAGADGELAGRLARIEGELSALSRDDLIEKVANLETRLAALESRPANATTPRPAVEPPAKPPVVDGWVLQGVQGDVAWVEGPGGFIEVRIGSDIPNVGTVDDIQKYEGDWLVVTTAGVILQQ